MSRHFLLYWKLAAVEYRFYGEPLDHITGDALKKVQPGDVVWIVTMRAGDLLLVGRVHVGDMLDESDVMLPDDVPFSPSRWHVIAAEGTAEPMQLINLSELTVTLSLRFHSVADRLRINRRGQLNALSLYHMRLLTDESASLLNYVWYGGYDDLGVVEHLDVEEKPFLYNEGKPVTQTRVLRQRSSKLVNDVKDRYLEVYGDLHCEVCGMSFEAIYGEIGAGYMEAHHPEPMAEMDGEQFVDADGIVLLCANCHRMAHRKSPPYRIEELRAAVEAQRNKQKG